MLVTAAAWCSPPAALAEEAYTTRIEPRPFYGATVTIEHGVRVFRPLPRRPRHHQSSTTRAASRNGAARAQPYGPVAPTLRAGCRRDR